MGVCLSLSACPYSARVSKTAGKRLRAALPTDLVQPFNPDPTRPSPSRRCARSHGHRPLRSAMMCPRVILMILTPRRHLEGTGRRLRSPTEFSERSSVEIAIAVTRFPAENAQNRTALPVRRFLGAWTKMAREGKSRIVHLDGDGDCAFCDGNEKTKLARLGGARPIQSASPGSSVRYLPDLLS